MDLQHDCDKRLTFIKTFVPGPILECLIDQLPFAALRSLQLTCRWYSDLYTYALPSKWQIDPYLGRWFPDPKSFRTILAEHGGIISGSAALHFFDRSLDWQPSDLDIYLWTRGSNKYDMHWHLCRTQGYVYNGVKTAEEARYPVANVQEVRTYSRRCDGGGVERVQLIYVTCSATCAIDSRIVRPLRGEAHCVSALLNGFHSTAVMNYLTSTEAVSLFPQTTFAKRTTYLTHIYRGIVKKAVNKYVSRGWTIKDLMPRDYRKTLHPLRKARFVGDEMCWRITYGAEGVSRVPDQRLLEFSDAPLWWIMNEYQYTLQPSSAYVSPSSASDAVLSEYAWSYATRLSYWPITCQGSCTSTKHDLCVMLKAVSAADPACAVHPGCLARDDDWSRDESWPRYCSCGAG